MRYLLTLFLFFTYYVSFAQNTYQLSDAIDIPREGWNKVLLMGNGNTLLFHFEERKGIVVKVFNKDHKEIASKKHLCKILDINQLDQAIVSGFFDINNEATLFIQQTYFNKHSLILLRFNPNDGSLIEEKVLLQSESLSNRTDYTVFKNKNDDTYSVFCMRNIVFHTTDTLDLLKFNNKHIQVSRSYIKLDAKPFDRIYLIGACIDGKSGALGVTLLCSKTAVRGIHPVYDYFLSVNFLSRSAADFNSKMMQLPRNADNVYSSFPNVQFSYDAVNDKANLMVLDASRYEYQDGIARGIHIDLNSLYLSISGHEADFSAKWVSNKKIVADLKDYYKDTSVSFAGIPVKMYATDSGHTVVVYEEYSVANGLEDGMVSFRTTLGHTAIAEYDNRGTEIWGIALPKSQSFKSFLGVSDITERGNFKRLFRGQRPNDYQTQFASIDCMGGNDKHYIFYNDYADNSTDTLDNPELRIVKQYQYENAFENTNAFYYRMDANKELKKFYLFGHPEKDEAKANFLESADFDDSTSTYATLLLYRKGKQFTSHLAWCKME